MRLSMEEHACVDYMRCLNYRLNVCFISNNDVISRPCEAYTYFILPDCCHILEKNIENNFFNSKKKVFL